MRRAFLLKVMDDRATGYRGETQVSFRDLETGERLTLFTKSRRMWPKYGVFSLTADIWIFEGRRHLKNPRGIKEEGSPADRYGGKYKDGNCLVYPLLTNPLPAYYEHDIKSLAPYSPSDVYEYVVDANEYQVAKDKALEICAAAAGLNKAERSLRKLSETAYVVFFRSHGVQRR